MLESQIGHLNWTWGGGGRGRRRGSRYNSGVRAAYSWGRLRCWHGHLLHIRWAHPILLRLKTLHEQREENKYT